MRFSRFYQSTLYMPVVLSLAVVGFIAQLVFSRDQGALNAVIGDTASPTDWLGDPDLNIWMVLLAAAWRHTGYVMILYLAGLKAVDPSLKEAAAIDGAGEAQTFFRIVLPTLRPVNVIVGVITVIEALRAFDIVYAVNHGRNGLELLSVLVTENIIGEASRIGFGSAIAVVLLVVSLGFVVTYLVQEPEGRKTVDRASRPRPPHRPAPDPSRPDRRPRLPDGGLLAFLAPLLLAVYASLRPYDETAEHGYFSLPRHLSLDYYRQAFSDSGMTKYFVNTMIIAVPGVLVTLFLASFVAFALARLKMRGGLVLLMLFTAGNLLPQQVIVTPLYVVFNRIPLPYWMSDSMTMYDSYWAVVAVQVGFQLGFCVFVLANFMRTLPQEILEAAVVDGAGVWTRYWRITLPLCRPALAALGTLQFTWMYNDFLWALVFISDGDKLPITSALNNLRGQFFTDYNLLAAGSVIVALPTIVVFLLLQRHFIAGLTLGSSKG